MLFPSPWVYNVDFLDKHNIDFVCHDTLPYTETLEGADDVYKPFKEAGRFLPTLRTEGISTTDLTERVVI